jgi:hydrogenase/urease accessory protein HupE
MLLHPDHGEHAAMSFMESVFHVVTSPDHLMVAFGSIAAAVLVLKLAASTGRTRSHRA